MTYERKSAYVVFTACLGPLDHNYQVYIYNLLIYYKTNFTHCKIDVVF